jgi:putative FmdB family regulatory protein
LKNLAGVKLESEVEEDCRSTIEKSIINNPSRGYNPHNSIPREVPMPVYDYVCLDCHKPFETVLTLNEHDKETPKCPHCGSKNVEQEAAAFFAVTSRKS